MADRKLRLRRTETCALLVGALLLANGLSEGNAGGQPPKEAPSPTPPPVAEVRTFLGGLNRQAFNFVIKPDTPLKDLLPIPPKARPSAPRLIDDVSQVPEVAFQEPLAKSPKALKLTAHTMAKINFLNKKRTDGFMEVLLRERPDLAGLPMAMGETCRTTFDRAHYFTEALNTIKRAKGPGNESSARAVDQATVMAALRRDAAERAALDAKIKADKSSSTGAPGAADNSAAKKREEQILRLAQKELALKMGRLNARASQDPQEFWEKFNQLCAKEDKSLSQLGRSLQEHAIMARIAALMQVLAPESVAMRQGLVKYLAATSHAEATRALAKLAIFSSEEEIRSPAIEALKVRREKDYAAILLQGLRYPLPAVAKRATEAMTKLERTDLVPELVSFLEEADPRFPTLKDIGEKKVPVIRELVRINHHRNCLMCHAPAVPKEVPIGVTVAEVPRPDQPLPSPSDGYQNSIPEVLVRLDVTYLRQDFSLMQPVADANPWPGMQRFDYLVRNRVITGEEAKAFAIPKAGALSPYQRYALAALRELTGRDAAPTPQAWRKLLNLPARGAL